MNVLARAVVSCALRDMCIMRMSYAIEPSGWVGG